MYQLQYSAVQDSMNSGDWSNAADILAHLYANQPLAMLGFLKCVFVFTNAANKTSQDLQSLLYNYSLQITILFV